jgi:cytochrome c
MKSFSISKVPSKSVFPAVGATLFALGLICALPSAQATEDLAKKNSCFGCHAADSKLVGPSFKEIAKRYTGQDGSVDKVVEVIQKGSVGKWGQIPMPGQDQISPADAKALATWVLSTK